MSLTSSAKQTFRPTDQQQDFLDALTGTSRHLALVARAGCGKTSTILMAVDAIAKAFPHAETTVCAFNKAIKDEVSVKLKTAGHDGRKVEASTVHGMGMKLIKQIFKDCELDEDKVRNLINAKNDKSYRKFRAQIDQLVSLAKRAGFGFFADAQIGDTHAWCDLASHYDVDGLDDTSDMDFVVEAAQTIYRESLDQTNVMDFDDMILWPLVKNLRVRWARDFVFVDEAQDLSPARQALVKMFLRPRTGRMIVVGDDRQAIYGFTGADDMAMQTMIETLDATVLPLSVTWRCPKTVVALANKTVPDLMAHADAPEGSVTYADEIPADLVAGDVILCRNVAPLVQQAYRLIRAKRPAKMEGRDIGKGLISLAQRWDLTTIDELLSRLEAFQVRETQKAMAQDQMHKLGPVIDQIDTLRVVCSACLQDGQTKISDVCAFISNLFADGPTACIVLATYHRSKGREWDRVILIDHYERCPSPYAKQPWQLRQEYNLRYVAETRAKKSLVIVRQKEVQK